MKRAFALLAPAVLVVGLVACGDDDDSPDATTADTEATTDETTTDVTGDTEATPSTGRYALAGWWSRVGAALIDGIIVGIGG